MPATSFSIRVVCFSALLLMGVTNAQQPAAPDEDPFLQNVRTSEPLTAEEQLKRFHLPPGFKIELVAAEPEIQKPMNLAFDASGRLWVSSSLEYPFAAESGKGRDTLRILEDTQGDARADRVTVFADGLNIPIGLYPSHDGCLVYSISNIEFHRDTNDDGRADMRSIVYGPLDQPVDTHGMQNSFRRGLDGWLYVNHGFANRTTIRGADRSTLSLHSGNVYRIRLDGSRVEPFSYGQVNPFGSAWTDSGELITADCHSKPLTLVQRGAYYQSFGKPHDGLGFAPELLHHLHGSTGLAGVASLSDRRWPSEYSDGLLVGNVVTSRVHHDQLVFQGATPRAEERPDFLTCDDPWFRPVDLCLGPDGAIYVADFYNRIIGHYEVDIHHPGRDRHRGRIWKISYVGPNDSIPSRAPDLTRLSIPQIIESLDSTNLPLRMLATDYLSDVVGPTAVDAVRAALPTSGEPIDNATWRKRVHLRWVLFRWKQLTDADLAGAYAEREPTARRHAMRMLAESPSVSAAGRTLLLSGLNDADANVRRHAVDAMSQHVASSQMQPLLDAFLHADADDHYLRHGLRIALRNHLRDESLLRQVMESPLTAEGQAALADICLAVPSPASGDWVADYLQRDEAERLPSESWQAYLQHAAVHASAAKRDPLARLAQRHAGENLTLSVQLFQALIGPQSNNYDRSVSPAMRSWGEQLVDSLVKSLADGMSDWHAIGPSPQTWGLESRMDRDGQRHTFLSSLPGGEQAMSRLISKRFVLPATLTFQLCGHRGDPATVNRPPLEATSEVTAAEPTDDAFVQLRLVDGGQVVLRTFAPRHDQAIRVDWNCQRWAGREAVLEVVDAMDHVAYAWLAVSQFEPAVISLPSTDPRDRAGAQRRAAELIASLEFHDRSAFLQQLMRTADDGPSRVAAGRAWIRLHKTNDRSPLVELLGDDTLDRPLREQLANTLADGDQPALDALTTTLFQRLPESQQERLARQMTAYPRSAQHLLELLEAGRASGRLLQRPGIREPLLSSSIERVDVRIQEILSSLPAEDERLADQLQQAIKTFEANGSTLDPEAGRLVFVKNCSACHQVKNQGQLVGPQLDGIATRGLARVTEDLLAPYRNVDLSFRTTVINLHDGRVLTGLVRDRKSDQWTLVDSQGKVETIATDEIEASRQSSASIMPDNFATTLSVEERNQLLAFLLSLRE